MIGWMPSCTLCPILHALSDRTRRKLLRRLSTGSAMMTELGAPFGITRTAVAKHLRVLQDAGLISRSVEGRIRRCAIQPEPLREVERWLSYYRAFWNENLDSLARFAESETASGQQRKRE
jgi:DNA-binding transcriptional ArsR family regulator